MSRSWPRCMRQQTERACLDGTVIVHAALGYPLRTSVQSMKCYRACIILPTAQARRSCQQTRAASPTRRRCRGSRTGSQRCCTGESGGAHKSSVWVDIVVQGWECTQGIHTSYNLSCNTMSHAAFAVAWCTQLPDIPAPLTVQTRHSYMRWCVPWKPHHPQLLV